MSKISYGEIVYASNEKSCITGNAGFGIRSINSHITKDEAALIASKLKYSYELPLARQVKMSQLQEDPSVTTRYPRTYYYQKVRIDDGTERHVLACATYVGIDYGYFCGKEQYQRVGNNYVTDYLVFDGFPGSVIFQTVGDGHTFEPVDNTCRPDNPELQRLLTGEPVPLVDEFIDTTPMPFSLDNDYVKVLKALTQAYINRSLNKEKKLTKVIIKAPDAITTQLISNMQFLPVRLVEPMTFVSNFLQGYGVPEAYQMVFVNEYNKEEMYEKDYITVDFFNQQVYNIDDNYIYGVIDSLMEKEDTATIISLLDFLSSTTITPETDYEFVYKLFKISQKPELGLSYKELDADFFTKLRAMNLPDAQLVTTKQMLNQLLNTSLQSDQATFYDALRLIDYLRRDDERLLSITDDSRRHVADELFNQSHALRQFIEEARLTPQLAIYVISDNNHINGPDVLFQSLHFSNDSTLWKTLIDFYYSDCLNDRGSMERTLPVITSYLISDTLLDTSSREQLLTGYYPVETYSQQLYGYIEARPESVDSELALPVSVSEKILGLPTVIEALIRKAKPEVFPRLIDASCADPRVLSFLAPILEAYFSGDDADEKAGQLKEQVASIGIPVFNKIIPNGLLAAYARHCYSHPTPQRNQANLRCFTDPAVNLEGETRRLMETVLSMYDGKDSIRQVGTEEMLLAKRMNKDKDYQLSLFRKWLGGEPALPDIDRYINEGKKLDVSFTKNLAKEVWKSGGSRSKDYLLAVIDSAHWEKADREGFHKGTTDQDLRQFLTREYAWWRVLLRKFFKSKKQKS